jgi:hypothetical protein
MARPVGPFTLLNRPPRLNDTRGWERWYQQIYAALSGQPGIAWDVVDKEGSRLDDIETRNHNLLQFTRPTVTEDYTVDVLDDTIFGDATAGQVTITLPTAVDAVGPHAIKKIDDTLNFVTVSALAGETIDRALTFALEAQDESINVESDGANWHII